MFTKNLWDCEKITFRKCISAYVLAFVISITGLSACGIKANADSKTSYPPEYNNKEWLVKYDDYGIYINHIPYDDSGVFLVMPGDSLTFDIYEKETSALISGTDISATTKIKKAGMIITDDCSGLPQGENASFTASGQVDEKTKQKDERPDTYKDDTVTLNEGYTC